MAIYHLSAKVMSRGKGASAVAGAAYCAGEKLRDEREQNTHDYSHKEQVMHSEIAVPDHAPEWASDRQKLWYEVEAVEKQSNAQLARRFDIALPVELSFEQHKEIGREFAQSMAEQGMAFDWSIHYKSQFVNGVEVMNPHIDAQATMRPFNEDGTWGAKSKKEYILNKDGERIKLKSGEWKSRKVNTTDWDKDETLCIWRETWANVANKHLERAGLDIRIDHRSYAEQGIDKVPTIHLGQAAHALEQKGIQTELGEINRAIAQENKKLERVEAELKMKQTFKELTPEPVRESPARTLKIDRSEVEPSKLVQTPEPTPEPPKIEIQRNPELVRSRARMTVKKAIELAKKDAGRFDQLEKIYRNKGYEINREKHEVRKPYLAETAKPILDEKYKNRFAEIDGQHKQYDKDVEKHNSRNFLYKMTHMDSYNREAEELNSRWKFMESNKERVTNAYNAEFKDIVEHGRGESFKEIVKAADQLGAKRDPQFNGKLAKMDVAFKENSDNRIAASTSKSRCQTLSSGLRNKQPDQTIELPTISRSGAGGAVGGGGASTRSTQDLLDSVNNLLNSRSIGVAAINVNFEDHKEIDWEFLTPDQIQEKVREITIEQQDRGWSLGR